MPLVSVTDVFEPAAVVTQIDELDPVPPDTVAAPPETVAEAGVEPRMVNLTEAPVSRIQ